MRKYLLSFSFLLITINLYSQSLEWVSTQGSTGRDRSQSNALDAQDNSYTTGTFQGTVDFDPSNGLVPLTSKGGNDIFIKKQDKDGNLLWAKGFGSSANIDGDEGQVIKIAKSGNVYVTGYFNGTVDFDPGADVYNLSSKGEFDIFIIKLNTNGDFIWAKSFGGTSRDIPFGLVLDKDENVYSTGVFWYTVDFDPGSDTYNLVSASTDDENAYMQKLDKEGDFIWAYSIGAQVGASGKSINIDSDGNLLVVGVYSGTNVDFDPGVGLNYMTSNLGDVYIQKIDSDKNLIWVKSIDANGVNGILTNQKGDILMYGGFRATVDFDPNLGEYNITSNGYADAYILKWTKTGEFVWAKSFGGEASEYPQSLVIDAHGSLYITGYFGGIVDFDPGPNDYELEVTGSINFFFLKLSSEGNFIMAQRFGENNCLGTSIQVDKDKNIFVTGMFSNQADFDPSSNTLTKVASGTEYDVFLFKWKTCQNATTSSISRSSCTQYTVPSGKKTYSSSGTYLDTIANSVACDSIITINLTIIPPTTSTISKQACTSYTVPSGNKTYTISGIYKDTIPNSTGCDSIITINLTITPPTTSTISKFDCKSYTVPSGKRTYTVSGAYKDTIPNSKGCDSIITINLTIEKSTSTINPKACDTYTVPSGKKTYTVSGTYQDTIPNKIGCDSIMTINLIINYKTSKTINVNACKSYIVPSGKKTYTSSGTYKDTIANAVGCDSIITINLTIKQPTTSTISKFDCKNYTVPSGKRTYTVSGAYKDTIPNAKGCDSIITINLTIGNSTSTINTKACDTYTVPSGKKTYTVSGTYNDIIPNAKGCDSTITIVLTINTKSSSTINRSACESYTVPSGKKTYTASGTYKDTIPNAMGCDSLMTINLTIGEVNVDVTNNANVLTANQSNAQYQWIDCGTNQAIVGQTNQSFSPTKNGQYAVKITQDECIDTSNCVAVTTIGIEGLSSDKHLFVYPNPVYNIVNISLSQTINNATIKLIDINGRIIWVERNKQGNKFSFDLSNISSGVYFLEVVDEGIIARVKLVKD